MRKAPSAKETGFSTAPHDEEKDREELTVLFDFMKKLEAAESDKAALLRERLEELQTKSFNRGCS